MTIKVYYLDDEPFLLDIFAETFSSPDVEVTTFHEPERVLTAIKENPPQIFFVDYRLPTTTGEKLARQVAPGIAIALITGDINVKTQFPFHAIFEKPLDISAIQEFIDSFKVKLNMHERD